ncbi:MAG: single-stranded DNA-binding protein [bacterium]|nr:single-stranded DNA-binding protein [bacterium]
MEERQLRRNSSSLIGNISSIGDIKTKSNGKEYRYINIAQNDSFNDKGKFYPIFLEGETLDMNKDLTVGQRIYVSGKLESYVNEDKENVLYVKAFEIEELEKTKTQDQTEEQENDMPF